MVNIVKGSILDFEGDAIVNAANGFLMHGAGLAKVINVAATRPFDAKAYLAANPTASVADLKAAKAANVEAVAHYIAEQHGHATIATGNVGVTSAGALPYKGLIHAVGPVWNGGHFCERALLRSAYIQSCLAAMDRGWERIAMPALSVGLFGYPIPLAAQDTARALADVVSLDVTLYLYDPNAAKLALLYEEYEAAFQIAEASS